MLDTLQVKPVVRLGISFDESLRRFALESTEDKKENVFEEKNAVPFVKWVGGKRSIIHELIARLPKTFNDYYEPMIGGGALFFELSKHIKKVHLSDIN
jgi:DNA adenine methylase